MTHSLRRKLSVRAGGRTLVLVKRAGESDEHVYQKALLWALYLPDYPTLRVEVPLPGGSRYKPDLLALDDAGREPRFWGECGVVGEEKLRHLLGRHRRTHFVFSKWAANVYAFAGAVDAALDGVRREAPVELIVFPPEAAAWVGRPGELAVDRDAVAVTAWDPDGSRRAP